MDDNLKRQLDLVRKNTILEVKHGSYAYGTNTPTSDLDKKGICLIPDIKLFFGVKNFEQQDSGWTTDTGEKEDKVIFHLPKFFQLAKQCNPNIIEILFGDESDILVCTEAGRKLLDNRRLFLSRMARNTFGGYARGQLSRMKGHHRWTANRPQQPDPEEFKHIKKIPIGPLGTHLAQNSFLKAVKPLPNHEHGWYELEVEVFDKGSYEAAKTEWDHYQIWKRNRNAARAELEQKHGIDTKHAMHLVRLSKMCYEIITTGEVIVKRPDRDELLAIRNGAWSYEKIIAYSDEMEKKITEAERTSPLPATPNHEAIDRLQVEMIREALEREGNWLGD